MTSGFWADAILHRDDRSDAIAYCAVATGQGRDHQFEYRGGRADGAQDRPAALRFPRLSGEGFQAGA